MTKRIVAIAFIFACSTAAWMVLGASIFARTETADSLLKGRVSSTWGTAQEQQPPTASYDKVEPRVEVTLVEGKKTERRFEQHTEAPLPLESSHINVGLDLEHRQKGLLWYSTYKVAFAGAYGFRNPSDKDGQVSFTLNFPASQAIYDDLVMEVDDQALPIINQKTAAVGKILVPAGKTAVLKVGYRSQGLEQWSYGFGDEVAQVRDFSLRMNTNFKRIDFPENTLSPTEKRETPQGWELVWNYRNLVSGFQIAMPMPEKLQPGPLAGRISLFAPVSLFFFFFLMFIITTLRNIELHPMNYFFLSAAFFSF
ncbi:MAG: hypothetical protein ACRD3I_05185, partial [Terriglobales bacterium]